MLLLLLFYAPILFFAWALAFPSQAMGMIENLKQQLAHFITQQLIARDIHLLKTRFRKWGKLNGYKPRLIDEILDKHTARIFQRLEAKYYRIRIDDLLQ